MYHKDHSRHGSRYERWAHGRPGGAVDGELDLLRRICALDGHLVVGTTSVWHTGDYVVAHAHGESHPEKY